VSADLVLSWFHQRDVDFRVPELLWALALVPVLLLAYVAARRARRRVAGAFAVRGRLPRSRARLARGVALALLLAGLAGLTVGFARPVLPMETPEDHATVVLVLDASTTMRATDVRPTRFEAAKAVARTALAAVPERAQVAVVVYSQTAYILVAPTHDHGAAAVGIAQARTAEGAAPGDAIAVALAAIPQAEQPDGASPGAQPGAPAAGPGAAGAGGPASKVPATIVLVASGDQSAGRPLPDAIAAARDAHVPINTVAVGPRPGAEQKAPFDAATLRQVAQASGGRSFSSPSSRDWAQTFRGLGSEVTVRRTPQEIGQFVGAGGLAICGLAMVISLIAARRLV
jgi:Ca-activated chloride channel family protein